MWSKINDFSWKERYTNNLPKKLKAARFKFMLKNEWYNIVSSTNPQLLFLSSGTERRTQGCQTGLSSRWIRPALARSRYTTCQRGPVTSSRYDQNNLLHKRRYWDFEVPFYNPWWSLRKDFTILPIKSLYMMISAFINFWLTFSFSGYRDQWVRGRNDESNCRGQDKRWILGVKHISCLWKEQKL